MKRIARKHTKRPLAIFGRRNYAALQAKNRQKQPESNCRFPRFRESSEHADNNVANSPTMGRGGSRIFSTHTYTRFHTWCIFRLRQFLKSERSGDQKMYGVHPWSLYRKWSLYLYKWVLPLLWLLLWLWLVLQIFASAWGRPASARQLANRPKQVFVTGMGVDGGGENGLVAGESLGDTDILGASVDIRASAMSQRMKAESTVKSGAFLPNGKEVSELASGEPVVIATDENGGAIVQALPLSLFPLVEFFQLGADVVRENDLLLSGVVAAVFEDLELHPPFGLACGAEDVSHVQGDNLVFSKPGAQGHAEDDMVAETCPSFAASFEQKFLLHVGERLRRFSDCIGVVHSVISFRVECPLTWRRGIATIARKPAVYFGELA